MGYYTYNNELYHHGIKGQRWGVRRYQNPDGTLTQAGKRRYQRELVKTANKSSYAAYTQRHVESAYDKKAAKKYERVLDLSENKKLTQRAANRYNKSQAEYRDARARTEFWNKKAEEDLKKAKEYTDQLLKENKTMRVESVPKDAIQAAKIFVSENTRTYYDARTGTARTYRPSQPKHWMRKVEKEAGFDSKAYRKKYKEALANLPQNSVYYV